MLMVSLKLDVLFCLISTLMIFVIPILLLKLPTKICTNLRDILRSSLKERRILVVSWIICILLSGYNIIQLVSKSMQDNLIAENCSIFSIPSTLWIRASLIFISCVLILVIIGWMIEKGCSINNYCDQINRISMDMEEPKGKNKKRNIKTVYTKKNNVIYLKKKSQDEL